MCLFVYAQVLGFYHQHLWKLTQVKDSISLTNFPMVTVVVPARNEAKNIKSCLDSIFKQDYPNYEVIVADDHSTDETAELVLQTKARLLYMKDYPSNTHVAFKKRAIEAAIGVATGEIIVTTDADCEVSPQWLTHLVGVMQQKEAVFIVAPVKMKPDGSYLSIFQSLDFAILQGITTASVSAGFHTMANGANMGYLRTVFEEVKGFEGIDAIASGDDMLLFQKIKAVYPNKIAAAYSTESIVTTATEPTLQKFIHQRIRWASKVRLYEDKKMFGVLVLVYLLNVTMLVLMLMSWMSDVHLLICFLFLFLKTLVEWRFVKAVLQFFGMPQLMRWFAVSQPFHILYTVVSGSFGQFGGYQWKGRRVK
jgi:cellulose synthase/poly-beta-1,6-N-acetylglucosamine synthase-like glycosyltransferase